MTLESSVRDKIQTLISDHPVVVFMKGSKSFPQCGFSATVVEVMKRLGVDFHDVNVLADPELRSGIKEFTNWPTIPQVYIRGQFIGGSDIIRDMYESGELKELISSQ